MTDGCIFLIFAHPDDESFFAAGTMCRYAKSGARVVLCCATRGERGTCGSPPLCTVEELPRVRAQELRDACTELGVSDLHFLPYEDQQLANAPPDEIRAHLVRLIRQYRPQIVVTFDPNGANRHPDHVAISRFTADAVSAAADVRFLPETGPTHSVDRLLWVCPVLPWEETDPARLAALPGVDFLLDVSPWREAKARGLAAHRTQHEGVDRLFLTRADRDAVLSLETFRLGSGVPVTRPPADDLFDGLPPRRTSGE